MRTCAPAAPQLRPGAVVPTSEGVARMADLVYILLSVAFFATVALVTRRAGSRTPPGTVGDVPEQTRPANRAGAR